MADEIKKVKIKDLPQTTSINDDDIFVESDSLETYKVTASDIAKYVSTNENLTGKYIAKTAIGATNGVAPLNSNKKINGTYITYGTTSNTAYEGSNGKILETNLDNHLTDEDAHGYNTKINEEITRATSAESNLDTKKANIASPTLIGTPKAPTATAGTNTTQIATTAFVQRAVSKGIAASDALIFKGTIGTSGTITALPTTYKTGWTYRVITAGTYAGQVCEIGDLIIALVDRSGSGNIDSDWCVAQTNINGAITGIKSGDAYITTSQSGSVVTITHKDVTRSNTTSTAKPSHGGTFTAVKTVTSDAKGHVTGVDTETVTLPTYGVATQSANGLESAADKKKLDGIATGAEVNQNAFSNVVVGSTTISADSKTDSLTLVGSNVTLTPDATNDKITIGITKANIVNALGYTPGTSSTEPIIYELSKSGSTITLTGSDGTTSSVTDSNTTYSAATTSKNGLMSSTDKSKLDNTNIAYATCSTGAATSAKVVTISGNSNWVLNVGSIVVVKFTVTNTASSVTLNVNNTGNKSIWYNNAVYTGNSNSVCGYANRYTTYMYDGTNWVWISNGTDNNTTYTNAALGQGYGTCSTAEATVAKVVALSSYALVTGGIVAVKFTYAVPASATMNVNSKGAKAIYYRGSAITAGVIKAGDIATFIYNGSQYHLLTVDRDNNTDTKNTAGSTNTSSKIFLVGATSQAASPKTYSHDTAYVGTDGCLYSNSTRVVSEVISSTEPTNQKSGDYWLQDY